MIPVPQGEARGEAFFRALVESTSDVIATLDAAGRVGYVTPSAERVLGYAPDALRGLHARRLLHPAEARATLRALREALRWRGGTEGVEVRTRHADGSWRVLEVAARHLPGSPVRGTVVTCRDVTERRVAEEALGRSESMLLHTQKVGEVGRLAGGVAHDFNNVLTAVKGITQLLLLEVPKDTRMRRDLQEIDRAADRAAALTRQLLALSRPEARRPRELDLNALVSGMEGMLRRLVPEDVELVTLPAPLPCPALADPGEVEQVLLNLVVNARDAMPGGGRLTVETALDDALPGGAVSLRVSDTGTGMDRATVERIWEPFFTTKDAGRGTGLGLATVRGIVERSGGAVRVESEPGRGTVFHVALPRAVPEAAAPEEPAPAEARPAGGSETVLLVEDDEAVRTLVQLILERQGYTVLPAADGSQALRAVLRSGGPVHLLVTDVVMPGMNGRELAEQLAAHVPGVRVVYMSGYSEREMERYGIRGPDAVRVRKPFSPAQLARAVRDALDREVPSPDPEPTHP